MPPHTFLAPDCASETLVSSTVYWIVFSDLDRVDYAIGVSDGAEARDYDGSGWTLDGYAKRGASNVWSIDPTTDLFRIGLWAMEQ